MELVSKNRLIIAILLTIIFTILLYHSLIVKYINEGFSISHDDIAFYVINMDKDKERYEKIINNYKNSDFPSNKLIRYPAVIGKEVNIDDWLSSDAISELNLMERNGYRTHHHSLSRGGIGCFLSHYNLAKKLVNDSVNSYLVFEDDTRIHNDTYDKIQKSIENAPDDWDMILFYTVRAVGRGENGELNRIKSFWGLNCYIINKNAAKKIIKEVNETKIDGQIDSYLSRMIQQDKLKVYASKTHFVSPNSTDSNIQTILKPRVGIDPFDFKGYKI